MPNVMIKILLAVLIFKLLITKYLYLNTQF
jgi:hypothetical protein